MKPIHQQKKASLGGSMIQKKKLGGSSSVKRLRPSSAKPLKSPSALNQSASVMTTAYKNAPNPDGSYHHMCVDSMSKSQVKSRGDKAKISETLSNRKFSRRLAPLGHSTNASKLKNQDTISNASMSSKSKSPKSRVKSLKNKIARMHKGHKDCQHC
jgi:hypothetical protein